MSPQVEKTEGRVENEKEDCSRSSNALPSLEKKIRLNFIRNRKKERARQKRVNKPIEREGTSEIDW